MELVPLGTTRAECESCGDRLILLEGVIEEFLSCLRMVRSLSLRSLQTIRELIELPGREALSCGS